MITKTRDEEIRDIISSKEKSVRKLNTWLYAFGVNIPFCDNINITELEDWLSINKEYVALRFGLDQNNLRILVDKGHFRIESTHEYKNDYKEK